MPKIPRAEATTEQLNLTIQRMIEGKNDREIAILAGAYLEGLLFRLLRSTIVDSVLQQAEPLFRYPLPMSSFGNMISLAYAFGVIGNSEFISLQLVKNVRNHCAHSIGLSDETSVSFDSEPVKKLLREFHPRKVLESMPKEMRESISSDFEKFLKFDPRLAFRMAFCHAATILSIRLQTSKPIESPN